MSDDTIMLNLSDAEKKQPFYDLASFVNELAPEYSETTDKILRGEDVDNKEITKIIRAFSDMLVDLYNSNGTLDDPKMAHLHETIVGVGRQL